MEWKLIDTFFKTETNPLVKHQIDTFNYFVSHQLEQIVEGFNDVEIYTNYFKEINKFGSIISLKLTNPRLLYPTVNEKDGTSKPMTPYEARLRNLTYSSMLYIDITLNIKKLMQNETYTEYSKTLNNIYIGRIPIMLGSDYCNLKKTHHDAVVNKQECKYDPMGYFIISGNEKVLISQDRMMENRAFTFESKSTSYSHICEVRSVRDDVFTPPKLTTLQYSAHSNKYGKFIRLTMHHVRLDIPLFVLFRALGVETDKEITNFIALGNLELMEMLKGSIADSKEILSQTLALDYLSQHLSASSVYPKEYTMVPKNRIQLIKNIIEKELLPHAGKNFRKKALYVAYMARKLLLFASGTIPADNRDSYVNKRIDSAGVLMANLFRQYYGKMIKECRKMIAKELNTVTFKNRPAEIINRNNIYRIFKTNIIEAGIKYCIATGNWGLKSSIHNRQGVAQVLNRMTYNSSISHLRRVNSPTEKNGKLVQPRRLDKDQFGVICPAETPEGASVGLVKNLAIMTTITNQMPSNIIRRILPSLNTMMFDGSNVDIFMDNTAVFVNGDVVGVHAEPVELIKNLRNMKSENILHVHTGIVWRIKTNEILISTEGGRAVRPLIVLRNGIYEEFKELPDKWSEIICNNKYNVMYLDVEEGQTAMIAMDKKALTNKNIKYTHLEIHPCLILGALANNIPFCNHNQSPRNTYQCLWEKEYVMLESGSQIPIVDVKKGDRVITFDPISMRTSITRVIHQYVSNTNKKIMKITTYSGRSIIATEDHKFMTSCGWRETRQLTALTNIGIFVAPQYVSDIRGQNKLSIIGSLTTHYEKLPLLARTFGFCFGPSTHGSLDTKDAIALQKDIKEVGIYDYSVLGINDKFIVPDWIKNSSLLVQREFLAGFFSSCEAKISLPLRLDLINERKALFEDLKKMLNKFQISAADYAGFLTIYDKHDIIKYFDIVGFRYRNEVQMMTASIIEYHRSDEMKISLEMWLENVTYKENFLFIPVESVSEDENCQIADITVDSKNHTFIAGNGFASHNSAMGKQAIGIYATNFRNRLDTMAHILNYPQKPLVSTKISKYIATDDVPNGLNIVVAILCYSGFNQEDSIIINEASVQRGLLTSTFFRDYKDQCDKNHSTGEEEIFCHPADKRAHHMKPFDYGKLRSDGFIPENTPVDQNDVLIGKCMPNRVNGIIQYKDSSVTVKTGENGFVDLNCYNDKYFSNINGDGYKFCKVRVRQTRVPTIGDKMSSRHGQKGTIGIVMPVENMPFTKDGLRPDIIINPHAIPSRMTVAQLMETLLGKACCVTGENGDGTPFCNNNLHEMTNILQKTGFESNGNEIMYNGFTGEQMQAAVFMGPCYYQRLKHMVCDKIHSRAANGPIVMLTRQCAHGRNSNGGLRLGEMEAQCLVSHGASQLLKERMLDSSDNFRVFVCGKCKNFATLINTEENIYVCPCGNRTNFHQVRIPYSCKLLFQELNSVGINVKLTV